MGKYKILHLQEPTENVYVEKVIQTEKAERTQINRTEK
jgi:hypothetical protein